jgi:membrane protease subunit HflK
MAWNDSNNGNDRDPWGGRRNDQGPPDLDELLRKFQQRLSGLFGGPRKPAGGGGGGENVPGAGVFALGALALGVLLLGAEMFWQIEPAERGVVLRFGQYKTTLEPGPHLRFPRPIETVIRVNLDQIRAFPVNATMLTQDENIVDVQIAVQYRLNNVTDYLLEIADPDASVQRVAESAIRDVIGTSTFDFVIGEGRAEIALKATELMQQMLDNYKSGIAVTSVNLLSANPPEQVKAAYDDAIKAREDEQRKINEAQAYSNEITERAAGNADRVRLESQAYKEQVVARAEGDARRFNQLVTEYQKAPEVTRDRLYYDTMQAVLLGSSKVLVDGKTGSNINMLPLDKLIGRVPTATGEPTAASSVDGTPASRESAEHNRPDSRSRGQR